MSLLEALREDLGVRSVKDGCSPQGQCGCCTVLVDGAPRVACVTPVRRVAGRRVHTVDGLEPPRRDALVDAFVTAGASQCGFCTPGILCRLAPLPSDAQPAQVETALLAHLCRCTGWRSIVAAATAGGRPGTPARTESAERARIEGRTAQEVGAEVVLGRGGFADDLAPDDCLVAVPIGGRDPVSADGWALGGTLAEARAAAGKVQGRRSGAALSHPVEVPDGEWDITLRTTWVEPAYLEPDASWCQPGGTPASPLANGGAFGGKQDSLAPEAARMLADHTGRAVRVVFSREDVVRLGPKRPPVGAGIRLDGTGWIRVGVTGPLDLPDRIGGLRIEAMTVAGPPTSLALRGALWAEAAVLDAAARSTATGRRTARVVHPEGGWAEASVHVDGEGWPSAVHVEVDGGPALDEVVLRSYVMGAAHMALGWVCSEGIAVGDHGEVEDLTIRSFGVLRARQTPPIDVAVHQSGDVPRPVSDPAFAAVAAATWLAQGLPTVWPTRRSTAATG